MMSDNCQEDIYWDRKTSNLEYYLSISSCSQGQGSKIKDEYTTVVRKLTNHKRKSLIYQRNLFELYLKTKCLHKYFFLWKKNYKKNDDIYSKKLLTITIWRERLRQKQLIDYKAKYFLSWKFYWIDHKKAKILLEVAERRYLSKWFKKWKDNCEIRKRNISPVSTLVRNVLVDCFQKWKIYSLNQNKKRRMKQLAKIYCEDILNKRNFRIWYIMWKYKRKQLVKEYFSAWKTHSKVQIFKNSEKVSDFKVKKNFSTLKAAFDVWKKKYKLLKLGTSIVKRKSFKVWCEYSRNCKLQHALAENHYKKALEKTALLTLRSYYTHQRIVREAKLQLFVQRKHLRAWYYLSLRHEVDRQNAKALVKVQEKCLLRESFYVWKRQMTQLKIAESFKMRSMKNKTRRVFGIWNVLTKKKKTARLSLQWCSVQNRKLLKGYFTTWRLKTEVRIFERSIAREMQFLLQTDKLKRILYALKIYAVSRRVQREKIGKVLQKKYFDRWVKELNVRMKTKALQKQHESSRLKIWFDKWRQLLCAKMEKIEIKKEKEKMLLEKCVQRWNEYVRMRRKRRKMLTEKCARHWLDIYQQNKLNREIRRAQRLHELTVKSVYFERWKTAFKIVQGLRIQSETNAKSFHRKLVLSSALKMWRRQYETHQKAREFVCAKSTLDTRRVFIAWHQFARENLQQSISMFNMCLHHEESSFSPTARYYHQEQISIETPSFKAPLECSPQRFGEETLLHSTIITSPDSRNVERCSLRGKEEIIVSRTNEKSNNGHFSLGGYLSKDYLTLDLNLSNVNKDRHSGRYIRDCILDRNFSNCYSQSERSRSRLDNTLDSRLFHDSIETVHGRVLVQWQTPQPPRVLNRVFPYAPLKYRANENTIRGVVNYWRYRPLSTCFYSWLEHAQKRSFDRKQLQHVIRTRQRVTKIRTFALWVRFYENSYQARFFEESRLLKKCLESLRENISRNKTKRRNNHLSLQLQRKHLLTPIFHNWRKKLRDLEIKRITFKGWKLWRKVRAEECVKLNCFVDKTHVKVKSCGFYLWKARLSEHAAANARRRQVIAKGYFALWQTFVEKRKEEKNLHQGQLSKAKQHYKLNLLCRCLNALKREVVDSKGKSQLADLHTSRTYFLRLRNRTLMNKFVRSLHKEFVLLQHWKKWRCEVIRRQTARRIEQTQTRILTAAAFGAWLDYTRQTSKRRTQQRCLSERGVNK